MSRQAMQWAPWLVIAFLQGCAARPGGPLQSAWYLQAEKPSEAQIEVVLINRSPRFVKVTQVVVNKNDEDESRTLTREGEIELEPGELKVLRMSDFHRATAAAPSAGKTSKEPCLIPVSVSVVVTKSTRDELEKIYGRNLGDDGGRIHVELAGRLPSSLPEDWPKRCWAATDAKQK